MLAALAVLLIASLRSSSAGVARHPALAVARSGNAPAVPVLRGAASRARQAKCSNGASAAAVPFVGGEANAFNFSHFAGTRPIPAFPSGHATTAFALAFAVSAVWPQARLCDDRLCACDLRRAAWCCCAHHPSDVVAGALIGDASARCSCATGSRPAGWVLRSSATAPLCPLSGPRLGASKGCPGRFRPIKADAARRPIRPVPGRSTQPDECRFDFFRQSCGRRFHRCAGAQRGGERRAADCGNRQRARRPLGLRDHLCQ